MTFRSLLLLLGVVLGAAATAAPAAPSDAELADLEAQADYAFYTHDARLAVRVLDDAGAYAGSAERRVRLQYAHAALRRAQLASLDGEHAAVGRAGEACLLAVKGESTHGSRDGEALALSIGCGGYLALEGGLRGHALGARIDAWLEASAPLAPGNARLRLTRALALWYRTVAVPDRVARARVEFEAAALALDGVRGGAPGDPSWGAADAWLYAGHAAAAAGDPVAARTAYEHALLIAPEFAAARRALDGFVAGR
jgi:hypothetical protein